MTRSATTELGRAVFSVVLTLSLLAGLLFAAPASASVTMSVHTGQQTMADMPGMGEMSASQAAGDCCQPKQAPALDCGKTCPMITGCPAKCLAGTDRVEGIRVLRQFTIEAAIPFHDRLHGPAGVSPPYEPPRA